MLEYKQNKEKSTKKFSSISELMQFITIDKISNDTIKYGNLIFYKIDIPEFKQNSKNAIYNFKIYINNLSKSLIYICRVLD